MMSPTEVEKGQQEVESMVKELKLEAQSDNEGDIAGEYAITEDQKRAMMELTTQTEEDADLLDEEPPEYNVKGRLIHLNEELASNPTPLESEREHKVGFKPKIVDLVASPSPDYSKDEHLSSRREQDSETSVSKPTGNQKNNENSSSNNDTNDDNTEPNKKQYVVEQDGQFYIVSGNDLESASMNVLSSGDNNQKEANNQNTNTNDNNNSYNSHDNGEKSGKSSASLEHYSPSGPRPKSGASAARRNLPVDRAPQPTSTDQFPQPRSTGHISNSSSCLDNFTYNSPYAMTSDQKAIAREEARKKEQERKEEEIRQMLAEEERRRNSNSAFNAWLDKKKKEQDKQRQELEKQEKPDQREERKEAYNVWMKEKKTQVRQERLLKKRQQQEQNTWFFSRTREECEKAFKEWIRNKNREEKKQQQMERQRNRLYRVQVRHSKKTLALIKALKEAQTFRYAEYYGYRF